MQGVERLRSCGKISEIRHKVVNSVDLVELGVELELAAQGLVCLRIVFGVIFNPLNQQEDAERKEEPTKLRQGVHHLDLQLDPLREAFAADALQAIFGLAEAHVAGIAAREGLPDSCDAVKQIIVQGFRDLFAKRWIRVCAKRCATFDFHASTTRCA
jgi:hypothetical protein